ncbi:MAG: flagellar assembly protein FliW [Thermodesulfobacteriota bacterium]
MKIKTTRFGTIDIQKDRLIYMSKGMLGFPESKRFFILQHREDSPFYWYQSADEAGLAFVITSPFFFLPDYEVDVEKTVMDMSWDNEAENNLELYVVVNISRGSPKQITANLIGPLLINTAIRQAVQMVVSDSAYSHKFPLLRETQH